MALVNSYATLADIRQRLLDQATYTANTIAFVSVSKTISDSARGLQRFRTGALIRVQGSMFNDGFYVVASGNSASALQVQESLTDEAAGATVTITDYSDQVDDAILESIVTAASRWIDDYTGRRFYAATETRVYTARWPDLLPVDDVLSVTALATDDDGDGVYETAWTSADYDLEPANAALDGRPYRYLLPRPGKAFPLTRRGVRVTGVFGYAAVPPAPVREACLLAAMRLARRRDAVFGVTGSADFGHVRAILSHDPDVTRLLEAYRRLEVYG